jgi:hypothetical protein
MPSCAAQPSSSPIAHDMHMSIRSPCIPPVAANRRLPCSRKIWPGIRRIATRFWRSSHSAAMPEISSQRSNMPSDWRDLCRVIAMSPISSEAYKVSSKSRTENEGHAGIGVLMTGIAPPITDPATARPRASRRRTI